MINIFGLIFFIVAQLGYAGLTRIIGLNKYMSWITSILIQTILLYVLAMLNALNVGPILIPVMGCLLFVLRIIFMLFKISHVPFEGIHYFDTWMLILGIIMAKILWASNLIHYDNYSHWALIVKYMLYQGHLPAAGDTIISFTSYPPATALFITEFVKWVGFSNGAMLVGQFILIWASLYAIFSVLRDRSRALNGFTLCFTIALINVFNISIRMNNLLVDFVLPVVTAAGFAGIYTYQRKPYLACLVAGLFGAELFLTKNSGAMYVIMLSCYLAYILVKNNHQPLLRKRLLQIPVALATIAISYLPFLWWNLHVKNTFVVTTKHQISTKAYQSQLSHESHAMMAKITHKFWHHIFSFNSLSTRGIIVINLVLLIAGLFIWLYLRKPNPLIKTLLALDLSFVVYYISVLAMYLVSMPYKEAINLDGLERYLSSMVILNLLLGTMVLVVTIDRSMFEQNIHARGVRSFHSLLTKNIYQFATLGIAIFATILMISEIDGVQYNNNHDQLALPVQLSNMGPQTKKYNHQRILLVDPHEGDVASYYSGYVGKYYYFSDKLNAQENFIMSRKDFKDTLQSYKYVVLPEWHRTFTEMLKQTYHQSYRTGIYRVTKNGLVKINKI